MQISIPDGLGLYVHVPFCARKCGYCAFTSVATDDPARHEAFVEAVCKEIRTIPRKDLPSADTVFFGGGTPSLLAADRLGRILDALRDAGFIETRNHERETRNTLETTLEANPGTVDRAKLAALRGAGFNRLSLGAQSFDDAALRSLGRIHAAGEIGDAVRAARDGGFEDVSLDLIFGRPGQTLAQWEGDLRAAVALGVEHVSAYLLTVEPGTPLADAVRRGEVKPLDDALQAEMLLATADVLGAAGLARYEIANYAKPGRECRHNVKYWTGAPYLGFGPAAHAFVPADGTDPAPWGVRRANLADVDAYVRRIRAGESPVATRETLTREQRIFETIFLGLRMARGADLAAFERTFGETLDARHGETARRLERQGLLERTDGFLRLTRRALPVADSVMAEFGP